VTQFFSIFCFNKGHEMNYKEIEDLVDNTEHEHKMGLTRAEYFPIVEKVKSDSEVYNEDKFWDALNGITCMRNSNNETVIYHCDIKHALFCAVDNRGLTIDEWD
jgi:hypothetical protein